MTLASVSRAAGWYSKRTSDSIRSEKAVVGPLRADPHGHAPAATRAMTHVVRLLPIDVNPCVYGTTGEMNAQESLPPRCVFLPRLGRVAAGVEMLAYHRLGPKSSLVGSTTIPVYNDTRRMAIGP
jgi:hypothetical protein